ncbi:hypothetical protein BASA60_003177 [Batrachochytrium salamandrivorans]|nr:hypothetical protein BASA60_003177 [Batrachochytrium salamandrivorans]
MPNRGYQRHPHPTGGSVSGSESDSCGNGLDCESNGTPKGDDFSSDRSLELESTSSELSSQDPNAQEDGEVDPTTIE